MRIKLLKWLRFINISGALLFFSLNTAIASSLNATEIQIKNNVVGQQPSALNLLEQLVNINSGTKNMAGVHQVGEILRDQFEQLGFKTHWIEEPATMQRAGTLLAEHISGKGPRILLIGHLDTVFAKDNAFQKFSRDGNNAIGPGVIDDKGGDIVILYALKALKDANALNNADITVVLTGDEEDSGKPTAISRKALKDAAQGCAAALEFEWAISRLDTATIARRGIAGWQLETQGKEAHSSKIFRPEIGDGAIFELARILEAMRTQLLTQKDLTSSPGIILGGNTAVIDENNHGSATGLENQVAVIGLARGDLRFSSNNQKEDFEKKLSAIVNQHLLGTNAVIHFQDGIPPMAETPNSLALLKQYSQVSVDLGHGPVKPLDPSLRGGSDLSYIADIVSAKLGGLGAYGTGAHTSKETLDVGSLPVATERAAILIYRLVNQN